VYVVCVFVYSFPALLRSLCLFFVPLLFFPFLLEYKVLVEEISSQTILTALSVQTV
jgi:hypothetical protein